MNSGFLVSNLSDLFLELNSSFSLYCNGKRFAFEIFIIFTKKPYNIISGTDTTSSSTDDDVLSIDKIETKKSLAILVSVFLCSLVAMIYVYTSFPNLEE